MTQNTKKNAREPIELPDPDGLSFDLVVRTSWKLMVANFKPLLAYAVVPFIPVVIAVLLLAGMSIDFMTVTEETAQFSEQEILRLVIVGAAALIVFVYLSLRSQVATLYVLKEYIHDTTKSQTFRDGWKGAVGLVWPNFAATVLAGIVVLIGMILFIIPGLIAVVLLVLVQIAVVDGARGLDALRTSRDLVRTQPILVIASLFGVGIVASILSTLLDQIGIVFSLVGQMLLSAITAYIYFVLKSYSSSQSTQKK